MEEQEKVLISKQSIEVVLKVPVILCPARVEAVETGIKKHFPNFVRNGFPFFITHFMMESLQPEILYHITGFMDLHYNLFLYDDSNQVFTVGPYLTHPADTAFCEQIFQDNGRGLSLLIPLSQFCLTLPTVDNSQILKVTRTAVRVITGTDRKIPYLHYEPQRHYIQEISNLSIESVDEISMELLEHRYCYEKLLLQEVVQGSQDLALKYYRRFSQESQATARIEDPLRTAKSLGFSLNTMLRKSVEAANIHPVYLDIISSNSTMLIENANTTRGVQECKSQIMGACCRFVRKNHLNQYPPLVRRAITCIHIHLASQLTLVGIAKGIHVSPSYLSRLFNRETGDSISNYITKIRVKRAAGLLSFSGMSIQSIAFYVGSRDSNYFSRCFKKYKRMAPTKYRTSSSIGV